VVNIMNAQTAASMRTMLLTIPGRFEECTQAQHEAVRVGGPMLQGPHLHQPLKLLHDKVLPTTKPQRLDAPQARIRPCDDPPNIIERMIGQFHDVVPIESDGSYRNRFARASNEGRRLFPADMPDDGRLVSKRHKIANEATNNVLTSSVGRERYLPFLHICNQAL